MATRWTETRLRLDTESCDEIGRLSRQYGITPSAVVRLALKHGLPRAERELKRAARLAS